MDEKLDNLARRYALTRRITLGERLGFGVHGIVFVAEDNFKRECRAYRRLREEHVARILGFNVPQLLRIDEECHAIEMTIVPQPFLS